MRTASPVRRAPVREKSLPERFLHSNLLTWFVEDGGSARHVVEATVAVPASHLHLPAFPRDEGGIVDVDGEEVPSFWRRSMTKTALDQSSLHKSWHSHLAAHSSIACPCFLLISGHDAGSTTVPG